MADISLAGRHIFSFSSSALPDGTFTVVRFTGSEELSSLYHFNITLLSRRADLKLEDILHNPASLTLHSQSGTDTVYHGIVAECTIEAQAGENFLYTLDLVPKLWLLILVEHNQVFLDTNITDIISTILTQGGLGKGDFSLKIQQKYKVHEYCCQFQESHFEFFSRWLEKNGIYYYFDHRNGNDQLVITDTNLSHDKKNKEEKVFFAQATGLDSKYVQEKFFSFTCTRKMVQKSVHLRDYNYRKPHVDMSGDAEVDQAGAGEYYRYGDHFATSEEGDFLARIKAEELNCQKEIFKGESHIPALAPGFLFELERHFRPDFNGHYLCTAVEHFGNQAGLVSNLSQDNAETDSEVTYHNRIKGIHSEVQFRPRQETRRPRFTGTLNAHIDGAGSGDTAEIDEQGRYKVQLPFDRSDRKSGKASAWLRMMQPYAGVDHGMHFPLHKGTEVLLTFVNGNPDRPVIAGAVPNPQTRSVVRTENQTRAGFHTAGGTSVYADDKKGHEHLLLKAGDDNSCFRMGAGSPSSITAWSANLYVGGTMMSAIGSLLVHYTFAALQDTSITGWKIGLILQVIKKFMMRAPRMIDEMDRAFTDSPDAIIQREVDLVTAVSSTVEILVELYFIGITLADIAKGKDDRASGSAFFVHSKDGETMVRNRATGTHIYLSTDNGDITGTAINVDFTSGDAEDNRIFLISGSITEDKNIQATVEVKQGDVTLMSGLKDVDPPPPAEESPEDDPGEEPPPPDPMASDPIPDESDKNFILLVSGVTGDEHDSKATVEIVQGDILMRSGKHLPKKQEEEEEASGDDEDKEPDDPDAPEPPAEFDDGPDHSIWLISGYNGDEGNKQATVEVCQGKIELVSGGDETNFVRLKSGPDPLPPEKEEDGDDEDKEKPAEAEDDGAPQAIIELKQGKIVIQSGDANITLENGEIKMSGVSDIGSGSDQPINIGSDTSKISIG